jgi:hypothetical protein
MPRVFIALENAASAFGHKGKNTANKPKPAKKPTKREEQAKTLKYARRLEMAKKVGYNPNADASEGKDEENIHFVVKMICARTGFSYGTAGSLPSLFKRLKFEAGQKRMSFDTLIFLGHGNVGVMTVGMGQAPTDKMEALKGKDKQVYGDYNAEKRMINVSDTSKAHWLETFSENRDCLGVDQANEVLHVFFLGCATGNQSEATFKILPQTVSQALAELLRIDVICYGADSLIENAELENVIVNIGAITDTVGGSGGLKGSQPLNNTAVSLEWYRRNA